MNCPVLTATALQSMANKIIITCSINAQYLYFAGNREAKMENLQFYYIGGKITGLGIAIKIFPKRRFSNEGYLFHRFFNHIGHF